jgi:hypothetical protein
MVLGYAVAVAAMVVRAAVASAPFLQMIRTCAVPVA